MSETPPGADALSRRRFLQAAGVAGALGSLPRTERTGAAEATDVRQDDPAAIEALFFFTEPEAQFMTAAVERLIPADPEWPGAAWAGVVYYIDKQLAGPWGAGARMYLQGPWRPEAPPQQGYQLRFTPAELYRIGIAETRAVVSRTRGREFWELEPQIMDEVLAALESGRLELPSLPPTVFFETLLANTVEGYFADPAYGGNRDMVGWRLVGFPGAYAQYVDLIELYDLPYTRPPISMTDQVARQHHLAGHGG